MYCSMLSVFNLSYLRSYIHIHQIENQNGLLAYVDRVN